GYSFPYISAHSFFSSGVNAPAEVRAPASAGAQSPGAVAQAGSANAQTVSGNAQTVSATALEDSKKIAELLKDAYVLIGVTALGVFDMRAFPFDSVVAGVEAHATLLDNLLVGDLLVPSAKSSALYWVLFIMLAG